MKGRQTPTSAAAAAVRRILRPLGLLLYSRELPRAGRQRSNQSNSVQLWCVCRFDGLGPVTCYRTLGEVIR